MRRSSAVWGAPPRLAAHPPRPPTRRPCAAGVDGFIVVDLPPEEASSFTGACDPLGLYFIPLVAPTTTDDRLRHIATLAKGYLYCVSITGITGSRTELPPHLGAFMERVRAAMSVPLVVGFGLSTRAHVEAVGKIADGAVMVGSGGFGGCVGCVFQWRVMAKRGPRCLDRCCCCCCCCCCCWCLCWYRAPQSSKLRPSGTTPLPTQTASRRLFVRCCQKNRKLFFCFFPLVKCRKTQRRRVTPQQQRRH